MNNLSDKGAFRVALSISGLVLLVVVLMFTGVLSINAEQTPSFVFQLPLFHALVNGSTALLLVLSLRAIKSKKVELHKRLNLAALSLSALFLISYVIYHSLVPSTSYGGEGFLKYIYFFILITHIALSAVVLPLVLVSFWYGLKNKVVQHKKIVRFAFPIWLYVAVTGVLVYILIAPYYQF